MSRRVISTFVCWLFITYYENSEFDFISQGFFTKELILIEMFSTRTNEVSYLRPPPPNFFFFSIFFFVFCFFVFCFCFFFSFVLLFQNPWLAGNSSSSRMRLVPVRSVFGLSLTRSVRLHGGDFDAKGRVQG